jgi:hypothetical protein
MGSKPVLGGLPVQARVLVGERKWVVRVDVSEGHRRRVWRLHQRGSMSGDDMTGEIDGILGFDIRFGLAASVRPRSEMSGSIRPSRYLSVQCARTLCTDEEAVLPYIDIS